MALGKFSAFRAKINGRGVEIKSAVVAGALANTNIAVAGIRKNDQLLAVLEFTGPGEAGGVASVNDRGATTSITSAGNIQCTVATNTTADRRLVVLWASLR